VREKIKVILQVLNESLTEKYLGMPTDLGKCKNGSFKFLRDRIWKYIQGWMADFILWRERGTNKICSSINSNFFHVGF
jgi:hypothetical protein